MRILITGGAGCLGAALVEHLLPAGHQILVIDNFTTGKRGNLPAQAGIDLVEGSVTDQPLVDRAFDAFKPTHVIHSAASYKDPNDWVEDARTNMVGTIHVVNAARRHGVKRFLNFQTALSYGRTDQIPIPADHPLRPFTSYGISKVAGEQVVAASGLSYASLRIANVTGPRLVIGPIPTFYKRLKAGQKCFCSDTVRDFLDMADFLSMIDLALSDDAPSGVFNVSSGEGHSIKQVFDIVVAYLGLKLAEPVPIVPAAADDVATVVLDRAETGRVFGWRPSVPFEQAVRGTLAWYDRHGVTDVFSHLKAPVAR
ncbi:MAG: NAD-dependent epimerase/dehydratase family protein [Pseudolabrys sp.]